MNVNPLPRLAELEAGLISERTKAALAYKARGGLLGAARPGAHRLKGGANPKAARRAGEVSAANAAAAYARPYNRTGRPGRHSGNVPRDAGRSGVERLIINTMFRPGAGQGGRPAETSTSI
jgi:hypothetical protein